MPPRPFYVVSHNPNTEDDVNTALNGGANALEPDIIKIGSTLYVCHDPDTFALESGWLPLDQYLDKIHVIAAANKSLTLIAFDCKPSVANAADGWQILNTIRTHLTDKIPELKIIISVGSLEDKDIFTTILSKPGALRQNEGVMIDSENDPGVVVDFFKAKGVTRGICYGNGTAGTGPNMLDSIKKASEMRKAYGFPNFTYAFTFKFKNSMRNFIEAGVDGIIPFDHYLYNVVDLVNERSDIRLATRADDPFGDHADAGYGLEVATVNETYAGTNANITFTLTGTLGTSSVKKDASEGFERGDKDFVMLPSGDLGELRSIKVSIDDTGAAPDWKLDYIKIFSSKWLGQRERTARFNMEITPGKEVTRNLFGTYMLEVKTADVKLAGTDANITFVLNGVNGSASTTFNAAGEDFERGKTNTIPLPAEDLGLLKSISVSHDGSGANPDWNLTSIKVTNSEWLDPNGKFAPFGVEVKKSAPATSPLYPIDVQITWPTPADITYGTPLSSAQHNAIAKSLYSGQEVPGHYGYSPETGSIIDSGEHDLKVRFTPSDYQEANFIHHEKAEATVHLYVRKAMPKIIVSGGVFMFNEKPHEGEGSALGGKGEPLDLAPLMYEGITDAGEHYGPTESPPTDAGVYTLTVSTAGNENNEAGSKTAKITIFPAKAKVLAVEALRIRKGPSIHANVLDWLRHDEIVNVISTHADDDGKWAQIKPGQWSSIRYKEKTWMEYVLPGRE